VRRFNLEKYLQLKNLASTKRYMEVFFDLCLVINSERADSFLLGKVYQLLVGYVFESS
jgi:hypothetical protein